MCMLQLQSDDRAVAPGYMKPRSDLRSHFAVCLWGKLRSRRKLKLVIPLVLNGFENDSPQFRTILCTSCHEPTVPLFAAPCSNISEFFNHLPEVHTLRAVVNDYDRSILCG